jgi:hypothetical protein
VRPRPDRIGELTQRGELGAAHPQLDVPATGRLLTNPTRHQRQHAIQDGVEPGQRNAQNQLAHQCITATQT